MANKDFGFTRDKRDAEIVQAQLNPLPRSVNRQNVYELLNGEWRFGLDLEDRGLREHWFVAHEYDSTAVWPGSIEAHMAAARNTQQQTPAWQDTVVAWYEREFSVPENWFHDAVGLLQITFGACGYETRVWLNGHPLQTVEGEEAHLGEYTSFSYELPPEHLQQINRVTVRISDSMDAEIPRGKQQSHVYKRGGIWYQTYTGAVRSVWLEPVERNRLRSRLNVISSFRDRFVAFDLTTRIHDPGLYSLRLTVTPRGGQQPIASMEVKLPLEAGEKRQRVSIELPEAELWSPASPQLYHLIAQLTGADN